MPGGEGEVDLGAASDDTGSIGNRGAVEEPLALDIDHGPVAGRAVELGDATATPPWRAVGHGTIFAIGSSTMSVAPPSRSAGIKMLISLFGTTVSTA